VAEILSKDELGTLIEMMATQKAALDKVQGLLDDLYPGLKASYSMAGIAISGPQTQSERFFKDLRAFTASKNGEKPVSEH
jgi:hypothetical protein